MSGSPPGGNAPGPLGADDLERALHEHLPALRAYVRARLGPALSAHESASDLVQSVCRELLADQDHIQYRGDAAFRGWLFTTALRKICQRDRYWRADKRAGQRISEERAQTLLTGYADLITPSRELSAREQVDELERALAALPDADREIIALAKIAGLPHAEIAARTGRTEEASRQALRRALVRLAAQLDGGGA